MEYYRRKVGEVRSSAPTADALKTAVLAGLLLADEVLRTQQATSSTREGEREDEEIVILTEKLIQTLDECLVPDSKESSLKASPSTRETSSFE